MGFYFSKVAGLDDLVNLFDLEKHHDSIVAYCRQKQFQSIDDLAHNYNQMAAALDLGEDLQHLERAIKAVIDGHPYREKSKNGSCAVYSAIEDGATDDVIEWLCVVNPAEVNWQKDLPRGAGAILGDDQESATFRDYIKGVVAGTEDDTAHKVLRRPECCALPASMREAVKDMAPLHLAASKHRTDLALALIKQGAIINLQDSRGLTAAHHAVLRPGGTNTLKALIQENADLNIMATGYYNCTPLLVMLQRDRCGDEPGFLRQLRMLIWKKSDVNAICSQTHMCALDYVLEQPTFHLEALALVLSHKANPNFRTGRGETALQREMKKDLSKIDTTIIANLLTARADPKCELQGGLTPLSRAALGQGRLDLVRSLCDSRIQFDVNLGFPLCTTRNACIAQELVDKRADVNLDCGGCNALHIHAEENSVDVVKVLLAARANPSAKARSSGRTPLEIAESTAGGHQPSLEVARVLHEHLGLPAPTADTKADMAPADTEADGAAMEAEVAEPAQEPD